MRIRTDIYLEDVMRLFIAEKPSLGRAIAAGLGSGKEKDGAVYLGSDIVTWCFGHILEQCSPEDYDEKYKRWCIEDLPILPQVWKNKVKPDAKKQYLLIKKLVHEADEIVNAGDPDREGQLLVDEVLADLGVLKGNKNIQRILLNALDEKSVREALGNLRSNQDFVGLRSSALARSRADWLIGMNLSRIYTIRAREAGYQNIVSVGRVQTPTMGLVVRREIEIKTFRPITFFTPRILWQHEAGSFLAKWKPREMDGVDAEGRIVRREVAEQILAAVRTATASIRSMEQKKGTSPQRLPYSLSALQIDAGKIYGYAPQEVLDTQQALYEKKLTSYPRSDCDYLPENQLADKDTILDHLAALGADFSPFAANADRQIRSRAWNDKKISAHHAIIPTTIRPDYAALTEKEKNLYALIAKAYIAQFYPVQEFLTTKIEVSIGEELFAASGKVILQDGWRVLYKKEQHDTEDGEDNGQNLPHVREGDSVSYQDGSIQEGVTKPPARFTPATLLKAMKEIHKYVKDTGLKDRLKECSGIGTEATRASIIEMLQKREYIRLEKKQLVPTELSISLCKILPDKILFPDITAQWEFDLDRISTGSISIKDFFAQQEIYLRELLDNAKTAAIAPSKNSIACPQCGKTMRRMKSAKGYFWGCTGYPECRATFPDKNGKPDTAPKRPTMKGRKFK